MSENVSRGVIGLWGAPFALRRVCHELLEGTAATDGVAGSVGVGVGADGADGAAHAADPTAKSLAYLRDRVVGRREQAGV